MRRLAHPLVVLLLLLVVWSGWFIYRTSFVVEGRRWFCLFDDAMISMTYARNLVEGHGLNWARWGEPVEGFTHPLWVLLMIPVNALPLALPVRSLAVQILSLLSLAATVIAVRRLVLAHFSRVEARHGLPAAVLTAFYYPLAFWALMGMETGLQALLAVAVVHLGLSTVHAGRDRHLGLWLLCAAAVLLRMDMVLLVLAVQLYLVLGGGLRPAGRASWLGGLAVFCVSCLAYGLFRWFYFHDLLPNTYYLKLAGVPLSVRLLRGLSSFTAFLRDHLAFLLPVGLGTGALMRRHPRFALPAAVFALYCAYSVWIGGDAWDGEAAGPRANRFIAFTMPLVFAVFNGLLNEILADWRNRREGPADSPNGRFVSAAATAVALLLLDGLWLSARADENWRTLAVTSRPLGVERHRRVVGLLHGLRRVVRPGATVACAWAGIPAYFSDYRMIDILGYNDRVVARLPPAVPLDEDRFELFRPGHSKWSQDRLLREQRPDAFLQTWGLRRGMSGITAALPRHGYRKVGGFWVRADSPYVDASRGSSRSADRGRSSDRSRPPAPRTGSSSARSRRSTLWQGQ